MALSRLRQPSNAVGRCSTNSPRLTAPRSSARRVEVEPEGPCPADLNSRRHQVPSLCLHEVFVENPRAGRGCIPSMARWTACLTKMPETRRGEAKPVSAYRFLLSSRSEVPSDAIVSAYRETFARGRVSRRWRLSRGGLKAFGKLSSPRDWSQAEEPQGCALLLQPCSPSAPAGLNDRFPPPPAGGRS